MRILEQKRIWLMKEQIYETALNLILKKLKKISRIDAVIGIKNGGHKLGEDLSNELKKPYYFVEACYNLDNSPYSKTLSSVFINSSNLSDFPKYRNIVLVDDICGTGDTIKNVKNYLDQSISPKSVITVTLCLNEGSEQIPDLYVWTVKDWVLFPWELNSLNMKVEPLEVPISLKGTLLDEDSI